MIDSDPRYRRQFSHLEAACEGLREQWADKGAPIAQLLRPGLSGAAIDDLAAEHGLRLPPELRFWWSWHDGVDTDWPPNRTIGPGGYELLSLEQALDAYQMNREVHQPDPAIGDDGWLPSWIPFMTQGPQRLYIDCDRMTAIGQSPVRLVAWEWDNYDVDCAQSLEHAVLTWTWLLGEGFYSWTGEHWDCDFMQVPVAMRSSGLT